MLFLLFQVSNVIEPSLFGRSMEMHPVVVLLSLAFWGALWGVFGCLLSIPLTVTMRIVFSHWRASANASIPIPMNYDTSE